MKHAWAVLVAIALVGGCGRSGSQGPGGTSSLTLDEQEFDKLWKLRLASFPKPPAITDDMTEAQRRLAERSSNYKQQLYMAQGNWAFPLFLQVREAADKAGLKLTWSCHVVEVRGEYVYCALRVGGGPRYRIRLDKEVTLVIGGGERREIGGADGCPHVAAISKGTVLKPDPEQFYFTPPFAVCSQCGPDSLLADDARYPQELGTIQSFGCLKWPGLHEKCSAGNMQSCNQLGVKEHGRSHSRRAASLFAKACDSGFATACANLGKLHLDNDAGMKDMAKAAALLKRACDGGYKEACQDRITSRLDDSSTASPVPSAQKVPPSPANTPSTPSTSRENVESGGETAKPATREPGGDGAGASLARPWVVVVASLPRDNPASRGKADAKAAALKRAGFAETRVVDGTDFPNFRCCYWVVVVGQFADRAAASELAAKLKGRGFDAYPKKAF